MSPERKKGEEPKVIDVIDLAKNPIGLDKKKEKEKISCKCLIF
jgi:hypothetical protein